MRPQPADPDRPPRAFRLSSVFLVSLIVVSALAVSAAGALWVVGDIVGFRSTAAEIRTRYEDFARQRLEREVERAVAYVEFRIASLEGELRTRLEERVRRTAESSEALYAELNRRGMGHDAALGSVLSMLRPIRFDDGRGYIFATTLNGRQLLYPTAAHLEGAVLLDLQDARGNYVVRDEIELVRRQGSGFATGFWRKPDAGTDMAHAKITFVQGLPGLDLYIGTGEYLDDFAADVRRSSLQRLSRIRFGAAESLFVIDAETRTVLLEDGRVGEAPLEASQVLPAAAPGAEGRLLSAAADGGGFFEVVRHRPAAPTPIRRLVAVKPYPEWRWIIGAGTDLDEIEPTIAALEDILWRELFQRLIRVGLVFGLVLLAVAVGARTITRALRQSVATFVSFFDSAAGSATEIPVDSLRYTEFRELADAANRMVRDRRRMDGEREQLQNRLAQSRKMEALGLLAGGVAHDLNNILSGVLSYPDLILSELEPDSRLCRPIETIRESGRKAAAVVEDLVTVARGSAARFEVFDCNHLVARFLASGEVEQIRADHPGVDIAMALGPVGGLVVGSPVHLHKALLNLTLNAAEACRERGTVVIETALRTLDQPLSGFEEIPAGEWCLVSVQDDGPGVGRDELQRIFEPFYTRKTMGRSGSGLGLTVVWNAIKDHSGFVDVRVMAPGTRFDLYLPRTQQSLDHDAKEAAVDDLLGDGETVLVVDDEPDQREIAGAMLRRLRYRPITVESGEAAVEWIAKHRADVVILDMVMDPGLSGRQTYQAILRHRSEQPAIIASGYSDTDDVRATLGMGAAELLKKPYSLVELGCALRTALGRSEGHGSPR
jgi:signal transduction histidine kinase/ActR/RegA family two-component response regulator